MPLLYNLSLPLAQAGQTHGMRELIDNLARTPLSQVVIFVGILTAIRLAINPILRKTPPHQRFGAYSGLRIFNEFLDAIVYAGVFVFMIIRPFGVQAFLIPSGSMWSTLYVNDFIVANKAIYRYTDPQPGDIVVFRPPVEAAMPEQIDSDGQVKVDFIKRCVGVPGDVVELRDGLLYRNGKKADDPTKHYSVSVDRENVNYRELTETEKLMLPKASFKLVEWNGKIIPLNYTATEANSPMPADYAYAIHPKFAIENTDDQRKEMALPAQKIPAGFYLMMGDNRNNSFDGRGWGLVPRESIIGRSEFIWLPISRLGSTPPVTQWRSTNSNP